MLLIGHRGACWDAPENTLASVNLAWRQNADAVEIDIHLSSDGRIVVMHDANTARTTGEDLVIAQTDSTRLRQLDAGSWKGSEFTGERIPFLEEVLRTVPKGKLLMVEVKCGCEILSKLVSALKDTDSVSRVNVISFNLEVVSEFKKLVPSVPTLWLRGSREPTSGPSELVEQVTANDLNGLSLLYGGVDRAIVDAARRAGQQIWAWTVNDPVEAKRLRDLEIDFLTTDRPGWMREQLDGA